MQRVAEMEKNRKLMPKFVLKEMESLYIEELKSSINLLMANLESLPVSKGSMDSKFGMQKFKRYNHRYVTQIIECKRFLILVYLKFLFPFVHFIFVGGKVIFYCVC